MPLRGILLVLWSTFTSKGRCVNSLRQFWRVFQIALTLDFIKYEQFAQHAQALTSHFNTHYQTRSIVGVYTSEKKYFRTTLFTITTERALLESVFLEITLFSQSNGLGVYFRYGMQHLLLDSAFVSINKLSFSGPLFRFLFWAVAASYRFVNYKLIGTLSTTTKQTTTTNCTVKGRGRERRSRRENSRVKRSLAVDDEFPM